MVDVPTPSVMVSLLIGHNRADYTSPSGATAEAGGTGIAIYVAPPPSLASLLWSGYKSEREQPIPLAKTAKTAKMERMRSIALGERDVIARPRR